MPTVRTPREQLERALHVSFKLPEQAAAMLDAYRDQVLTEAADRVDQIASKMRACDGDYPEEWSSRDVRDAVETAAQVLREMRQAAAR